MSPSASNEPRWSKAAAELLRRTREARGLSARELARRAGLSWVTVREAERGRSLRRSSLAALLATLPELGPREILFGESAAGRPASAGPAWEFLAASGGVEIRELVRVGVLSADGTLAQETTARGLRWRDGRGESHELAALLRSVLGWPAELARELVAGATAEGEPSCWLGREGTEHAVSRRDDGEGVSLTARSRSTAPAASGLLVLPTWHPVARARLELRRPSADEERLDPWSAHLRRASASADDEAEPDLCESAHAPDVRLRLSPGGRRVGLEARRLLPGLRLELRWGAECREDWEPRPPREAAPEFGPALRRAREAAGLSLRALATRTGISPRTLSAAESGSDPRASTLRACVAALPTLRAEDCLPSDSQASRADSSSTWRLYRELFGFEAAEFRESMRVLPGGECEAETQTRGLRALAGGARDLHVLQPFRSLGPRSRLRVDGVEVSRTHDDQVRTRLTRQGPGSVSHALVLPEAVSSEGITLRASVRARLKSARPVPDGGVTTHGQFLRPIFAVRRVSARLSFGPGRLPPELRLCCWPMGAVLETGVDVEDLPEVIEELHGPSARLRADAEAGEVHATIESPLIGFLYGITWQWPEGPPED